MFEYFNISIRYYTQKTCTAEWRLSSSGKITFNELTFILDGEATYVIDGISFNVNKGDYIFIPRGSVRYAFSKGLTFITFNFNYLGTEKLPINTVRQWTTINSMKKLLEEFNTLWTLKSDAYMIKCKSILMDIIYKLINQPDMAVNKYIKKIKMYITEHLSDDLTVKKIADMIGINTVYCGALFKREEGITITQYINRIKINKAIELFETKEFNISEVSNMVGYDNIYYFSRVFKNLTGISPREYINNIK